MCGLLGLCAPAYALPLLRFWALCRSPPKADVAPDEDVEFTVAFDAKKPEKELPRLNLPPAPGSAPPPAALAVPPPTLPVPNAAAAALGAGQEANLLPVPAGPQMPTEPGPY